MILPRADQDYPGCLPAERPVSRGTLSGDRHARGQ